MKIEQFFLSTFHFLNFSQSPHCKWFNCKMWANNLILGMVGAQIHIVLPQLQTECHVLHQCRRIQKWKCLAKGGGPKTWPFGDCRSITFQSSFSVWCWRWGSSSTIHCVCSLVLPSAFPNGSAHAPHSAITEHRGGIEGKGDHFCCMSDAFGFVWH